MDLGEPECSWLWGFGEIRKGVAFFVQGKALSIQAHPDKELAEALLCLITIQGFDSSSDFSVQSIMATNLDPMVSSIEKQSWKNEETNYSLEGSGSDQTFTTLSALKEEDGNLKFDTSSTVEEKQKLLNSSLEIVKGSKERSEKISYSRSEMESLRFVNIEEQKKIWNQIYLGLGPVVAQMLDNMSDSNSNLQTKPHKHGRKNSDSRQNNRARKKGEDFLQHMKDDEVKMLRLPSEDHADGEDDDCVIGENDSNGDNESEDEYISIQRPAFLVEGDPDFESGPPQDGLEYLRRVRWEAAKIPKVKVAKFDRSKLKNEQTVYMPQIPDIVKCPQHLMPSKQWEDAFLVDFSKLRLGLSNLESSSDLKLMHGCSKADNSCCFASDPRLSVVLGMDAVSRASKLRNHIKSLEGMTTLARNDCAWVFALCAAVDTPLDADTGATLRCLLRKCAELRAGRSACDDEVMMLNILVTICGRYFGQLEE